MIIKSSAGTEIAKNGYTVIDELNQIPMIKTNYLQLEHNHINPIILGSKAFEHKDIFINVVEDTETSGDTAFKEYNAIHEFAWVLSGMRKHDSYTGYLSLEQYLAMVLKDTEFTYQVEGGHQYYALQFENLGDGESHLDMFFKMLNRWNTEFELRGKKVYITHQRGRLRDKHVGRYKMNIIDTIINSDITDGATAVWGYFGKKDEENPENSTYREFYWQIDELVEQYGIRYAKPYSNENITQEKTMIEYLNNIILDSWKISTEVDIAEITDEVVQTGDEYVAVDERLGITLNTRIQKLESIYDADDKLLYQTATLGTVSFASAASGSSNQLQEVIEKIKKDYSERITDLKQEFDNRFNDEVTQIEIEFNELVNGVRQEIQADKEAFELRYKADKEALSGEIQSSYDNAVTEANRIVEAKEIDFKNYADGIGNAANGRIDDLYEGFGDLSSEFESLEIGGRNLVLKSDVKKTSSVYAVATYSLSMDWDLGQTYTVTIKGDINSGQVFGIWANGTGTRVTVLEYDSDLDLYISTFTPTSISTQTAKQLRVYNYLSSGAEFAEIEWIKLEKGNKATDWTPAPEDTDQKLTIIANDLDGVQTKVENNTGAITTVTQQANGLERRVENAEGNINTVTQLATGTQQRVTDAEGNINTITNIANGTQQTVTNMLNGNATKGTVFQNTVDGFLNRAWQTDIDNLEIGGRNLLLKSNEKYETTAYNIADYPLAETIPEGTEVTISIKGQLGEGKASFGIYNSGASVQTASLRPSHQNDKGIYTATFNWRVGSTANTFLRIYHMPSSVRDAVSTIEWVKLEYGNKATDWTPAPEDLMKYTDIIARPDGFLIGSFEMGGDKIAQAIVGKAGAIDLIAQNVNFTGNVNVANQIKTYSLEAVYADIAKLRTNILTANSVTSNALKVDTALINKLNTNSILTNYLIANTAMIENIKSKSLEAVYANISELRTRLLVADVITANMVKFDTALIEKFTSSTAFINSLTAKSAFISNVKAIDIDFNRASATGGSGSATLSITGDRILQSGTFNRIWKGVSYNYNVSTIMREGYIKFADFSREREISISAFGISTFVDGSGNQDGYAGSSGTISWWDKTYGNADGITISSEVGVPALKSFRNRVVLDADSSVDIMSNKMGVNIEPNKTQLAGVNRFTFTSANSASQGDVVGYLMFGAGTEDYPYGVGLRFNKPYGHKRLSVVDKDYGVTSDTIFEVGRVEVENVHARVNTLILGVSSAGEVRIQQKGTSTYKDLRINALHTQNGNAFKNHSGTDVFFGVGGNRLVITDNNGYNGGKITYRDIHFANWKAMSHEKYKYEINEWNTSILELFKEIQLYTYKQLSDKGKFSNLIRRSIVLRENPNEDKFPVEWRAEDGFDGNEVLWWNTKAIQELAHENDTLKTEIAELKSQINKIMEMIA